MAEYDPEFGMGDHMFNDLALSREMMRSYHSRLAPDSSAQKLSVMVLQQSVWPFSVRKSSVDLPPSVGLVRHSSYLRSDNVIGLTYVRQMQIDLNDYAAFYKTKHQGRKIDWDHALGTAVLRAQFNSGSKELSVSLYQAVALLLFNDTVELPFSDILAQTNMGQ
jgi:cullin-4